MIEQGDDGAVAGASRRRECSRACSPGSASAASQPGRLHGSSPLRLPGAAAPALTFGFCEPKSKPRHEASLCDASGGGATCSLSLTLDAHWQRCRSRDTFDQTSDVVAYLQVWFQELHAALPRGHRQALQGIYLVRLRRPFAALCSCDANEHGICSMDMRPAAVLPYRFGRMRRLPGALGRLLDRAPEKAAVSCSRYKSDENKYDL